MSSVGLAALMLFGALALLLLLNVPVSISLTLASVATLLVRSAPITVIPSIMQTSVEKFSLLAIGLFILAGNIMEVGGISSRLIRFCKALIGPVKGGLGFVSVLVSMFFAAISGSGAATVSAIGSIMIPNMREDGYPDDFSSALSAISGSLGTIIPPSITFVIYGMISGVSIGALFLAGVIPGFLMGMLLMAVVAYKSLKHRWGGNQPHVSAKNIWLAFKDAFWGLMSPVIVLGGIYGGVFTPTEAAAVAVIYSLVVSFVCYREITFQTFLRALIKSTRSTGMILLIVAAAGVFAYVLTAFNIASTIASVVCNLIGNKYVMLLIFNILFLIAGCIMDGVGSLYILVPIVVPIAVAFGIDLLHLGAIIIVNLSIGQCTPPVAANLYIAMAVGNVSLGALVRQIIPLLIASLIALALTTYIPALAVYLPGLIG